MGANERDAMQTLVQRELDKLRSSASSPIDINLSDLHVLDIESAERILGGRGGLMRHAILCVRVLLGLHRVKNQATRQTGSQMSA